MNFEVKTIHKVTLAKISLNGFYIPMFSCRAWVRVKYKFEQKKIET